MVTSVTITNPSSNPAVAFFLRADVRRGNAGGTAQAGDNQVLPITWSDNDITLWPGESQTLTATYRSSLLHGAGPVVSVYGWNVPDATFAAPQSAAAVAAVRTAEAGRAPAALRGRGRRAGRAAAPRSRASGTPPGASAVASPRARPAARRRRRALTVTSVANSPDTTPATSFTQGDNADTYTLTVKNTGNARRPTAPPRSR